jgi:hypothetical protein
VLGAAIKVRGCVKHSFDPATPVLMAGGTTTPIKDIQIGDQVVATDPDTGETGREPVEALHTNLTDVTVTVKDTTPDNGTDPDTSTVLHTTQHCSSDTLAYTCAGRILAVASS